MGRWLDLAREPGIVQFVEAVREFASLVERVERLPEVYFLQEMDRLLPLLYGRAHGLPDDRQEDLDEDVHLPEGELPKTHNELWQELRESVGRKLGENHRWAHIVYDTMSPTDHEVILADIADMIAEVYLDLVKCLPLFDRQTEIDVRGALWNWRFGLKNHWGKHALDAVVAINSLLHIHYDEEDEEFDI